MTICNKGNFHLDFLFPWFSWFLFLFLFFAGKKSFTWAGQIPRVHITDPQLAKEIVSKSDNFQKSFKTKNPLIDLLITGVIAFEGEKWRKHRRILNPAFQLAKLKVSLRIYRLNHANLVTIRIKFRVQIKLLYNKIQCMFSILSFWVILVYYKFTQKVIN